MTIETLTDEERAFFAVLPEHLGGLNMRKALRIIDAHATAHAALVAQLAELTRERDEARGRKPFSFQIRFDGPPGPESGRFIECETLDGKGVNVGRWEQDGEDWLLMVEGYDAPSRLESEVTRLTRERDEARGSVAASDREYDRAIKAAEAEVTRLTEALAAAERQREEAQALQGSVLAQKTDLVNQVARLRARIRCGGAPENARADSERAPDDCSQRTATVLELEAERDTLAASLRAALSDWEGSEARAAQWQSDAESYRIDATVAQDRLAALQERVNSVIEQAPDGFQVDAASLKRVLRG